MIHQFNEYCRELFAPYQGLLKTFDLEPYDLPMILVGAALFYIFWKVMDRAVFSPFLALHEAREAATEGSVGTANNLNKEADEIAAQYDEQFTEARVSAMQVKLSAVSKAKDEANKITKQASETADAALDRSRAELTTRIESLKAQTMREAAGLSGDIVEKLKKDPSPAVVH